MTREDSWSADWACERVIAHEDIKEANVIGPHQISLAVKKLPRTVTVGTMSVPVITGKDIDEVYRPGNEFILNIKKGPLIEHDAIVRSEQTPFGLGGVGDLYRAANDKEFKTYLPKETQFILRALNQHSEVESVCRINNRMYQITRMNGSELRILALNEYDLTADAIRSGIDRFGKCNAILASNPNCDITSEAKEVAKNCDAALFKIGQLLGALKGGF